MADNDLLEVGALRLKPVESPHRRERVPSGIVQDRHNAACVHPPRRRQGTLFPRIDLAAGHAQLANYARADSPYRPAGKPMASDHQLRPRG